MQPIIVFYDGWCPLCNRARRRLARLDWLGRLRFVSIRDPGAARRAGVAPERLAARLHVQSVRTGRWAEGIWAVAAIAARLPLLWPLWPLLAVAGLSGLGQPVYDFIARRRTIVPAGQCDEQGCPVPGPGSSHS